MSALTTLAASRKARKLTLADLASEAGVSRLTVQRMEAGKIDPRLSTTQEIGRALGLELIFVPTELRREVEAFLQSGGRTLEQPVGAEAPLSVVDLLAAQK
jgi:transcriptional regulator with XRE-family HTH domain